MLKVYWDKSSGTSLYAVRSQLGLTNLKHDFHQRASKSSVIDSLVCQAIRPVFPADALFQMHFWMWL